MISTAKLLSITFTCCIILSAASGTVADNIQPPTSLRGGVINTSADNDTFTKEDLELVDGRPRCCAHGCRHGGCVRRPTNCYWRHGRRVCPRSNTNLTNLLQVVDEAVSNDEDEEYDNEPDSYDDYDDNESSKNAQDETVGSRDVELVNCEY